MEFHSIRPARNSDLPLTLQANNCVDERRIFPRATNTPGLRQRDHVTSCFFDYTEPVEL